MAVLTTARTTAFMPALSPPDVRTASFIFFPAVVFAIVNGSSHGESSVVVLRPAQDEKAFEDDTGEKARS